MEEKKEPENRMLLLKIEFRRRKSIESLYIIKKPIIPRSVQVKVDGNRGAHELTRKAPKSSKISAYEWQSLSIQFTGEKPNSEQFIFLNWFHFQTFYVCFN